MDPAAAWVSRSVITDPDIYAAEQQAIFQRQWLVVAHESQLRAPGDFVASWIGEEPVIVSRDREGQIHVLLNSCSHRASKVCRVDHGQAGHFVCPNHGWRFGLDGGLLGVPNITDGYDDERLDKPSLGLVKARVEVYAGLIFATFAPDVPDLDSFLGDAKYYLDTVFDRYELGLEVLEGVQKTRIECNWKLAAENLGTDLQHPEYAHGAFMDVAPDPVMNFLKATEQAVTANGHTMIFGRCVPPYTERWAVLGNITDEDEYREVDEWYTKADQYAVDRLGEERANLYVATGAVFPTLSFLPGIAAMYVCHPKGPGAMEWWSWCLVPVGAPAAVRNFRRMTFTFGSGPGGLILAEDLENWTEMTHASASAIGSQRPLHIGRGLGEVYADPVFPGVISGMRSEHAQRAFWLNWRRAIDPLP